MCQSAWPYVPIPESGSARLNSPVILAARKRGALSRPRHALDPVQRCPELTRAPAVLPSAPGKLGLARTFWLLEAHRNRRHGTRSCAFGGGKFPAWVRADALALLPGAEWPKIWPGAFGCLTKAFLRPPPAQTNHARGGIPVGGFGHPPPGRGGKGEPSRTRVGRARGESLWRRKERGDGGSKATGRTRRGGLVERPPLVEAGDYHHRSPGPPDRHARHKGSPCHHSGGGGLIRRALVAVLYATDFHSFHAASYKTMQQRSDAAASYCHRGKNAKNPTCSPPPGRH